jgi:hypothetical protein
VVQRSQCSSGNYFGKESDAVIPRHACLLMLEEGSYEQSSYLSTLACKSFSDSRRIMHHNALSDERSFSILTMKMEYTCPPETMVTAYNTIRHHKPLPWLRRLVAGVSLRRPGLPPVSVHMGFVADNVALGQVLLQVLQFSPVSIIPPWLHTHISRGG